MVATEELFDLKSDGNELTNAAGDEKNESELNRMRSIYESHLYEIKEKAISPTYLKYKDLFDRKQTWESKSKLLNNKKR